MSRIRFYLKYVFVLLGVFIVCYIAGYAVYAYFIRPPKISVVMSTYNRERLLGRAIESILNQTYTDFELILIEDGSKDDTLKVAKAYAAMDKRIILLENGQNKGLVPSLNRGLEVARGTYIARMDDDDISLPTRFAEQILYMERNPDVVVVGTYGYVNKEGNGNFGGYSDPDDLATITYFQVPFFHPSTLIRRDFLEKHNIRYSEEYKSAEDADFWYKIMKAGGKFGMVTKKLMVQNLFSPKFKGYSFQQSDSYSRFITKTLAPFMDASGITFPPSAMKACYAFKHIEHKNKELKLLNQDSVERIRRDKCQYIRSDDELFVFPGRWINRLKKKGNTYCLNEDCAKVLSKTDTQVTIKWNEHPAETYELDEVGVWVLKSVAPMDKTAKPTVAKKEKRMSADQKNTVKSVKKSKSRL